MGELWYRLLVESHVQCQKLMLTSTDKVQKALWEVL